MFVEFLQFWEIFYLDIFRAVPFECMVGDLSYFDGLVFNLVLPWVAIIALFAFAALCFGVLELYAALTVRGSGTRVVEENGTPINAQ